MEIDLIFIVVLLLAKVYLIYTLIKNFEVVRTPKENIMFIFKPFFLFVLLYTIFTAILFLNIYQENYYLLLIDNFFYTFLATIYIKKNKG